MEYWVPGVEVTGVHELVGNALVMKGEKERTTDLRGEPLAGKRAMKCITGRIIIVGIVVFLVLATFPFWYGRGKAVPPPDLKLDTPASQRLAGKTCVETDAYMRANHMELIDAWREDVVREGKRTYHGDGRAGLSISLTGTCLGCHTNKEQFCDPCHDYAGVKPALLELSYRSRGGPVMEPPDENS